MKITVTKTITVQEELDTNLIEVFMGGNRDLNSQFFEIYYKNKEMAYGHLNHSSGIAHVSLIDDNIDEVEEANLIQFFETGIETKTLLN